MIEQFSWKGLSKIIQVQLPDHFTAIQKFKHIIEGIIQTPLEHCWAWGNLFLESRVQHIPVSPPQGAAESSKVTSQPLLSRLDTA